MTKTELIAQIMKRNNKPENTDISQAVNHLIHLISHRLEEGERIEIRGFGSFRINEWGARHARNPATGETWRTDPTKAVYFKPGKELKEKVNIQDNQDIEEN